MRFPPNPLTIKERTGIVHIMSPQRLHVPGDFAPIACSKDEGVVLPGFPSRTDLITCPDCLVLLGRTP